MSRFSTDRTFNPSMSVYCRRPFIANGRRYSPNDIFDWRKMSVSMRKVSTMFGSGLLCHQDKAPAPSPAVEPVAVAAPVVEPVVAPVDDLDAIDDMKELRLIADAEGAPYKVSKTDQRQAIRDNRKESI
jgi:hypothetical protein